MSLKKQSIKGERIPSKSGVYQIRCKLNGKIYIGSTVNLQNRWRQHKGRLKEGSHQNRYLQAAWNKYGEDNFEFLILEFVERANLLEAEQKWIDSTNCCEREMGYNIFDKAGSPGDKLAQIWEGFINPEGLEVVIKNLFDFCRQNNLDFPSMLRLAKGKSKLKSYKGWTHRNSVRKREFIKTYIDFISPDGQKVGKITNLAAFCRKHGLDKTHMVAVAKGRIYSHRGWTFNNDRQRKNMPKTYQGFISPNGQPVEITNLKAFCRENNLQVVRMHEIKNGKRKSHKGWTWRNELNNE